MPKLVFTQTEIDNYVKEKTFHSFYKQACDLEKQMCIHADGLFPEKLLYERRPNEPIQVMEYRKKIFSPITKPFFLKIFQALQKIRRSSDWSIRYEGEFPKIREDETLEDYCERYYPGFYSLTNWVFTLMLRKYLIDPNAVVFVHPVSREVQATDFLQPIAEVFDSKNVIDFVQDDYAVLLNRTGSTYVSGGKPIKGKTYYVITTQATFRYDQVNGRMQFDLTDTYEHGLGYLPCFQLKGVVVDQTDNMYLYESKVGGIVPEFDEALREYSDLQAGIVNHMYPERWEFTQNECSKCKGTGRTMGSKEGVPCEVACETCSGHGYTVAGPYSKIMVKPVANAAIEGIAQIPTPPAGFIEKDVEIIKIMDERVDKHIYKGLSSLSFEFLAERPLAVSGIKTAMDSDEMNNTVHGIAEDIVAAMDNIYWLMGLYRYKQLYPPDEIVEMIPTVQVPDKFDILSSTHTLDELAKAKTSKVNPIIESALEVAYTSSRFNTDPEIRDRLLLILELDPLPNVTEDEKMSRLTNKGITLESYVISSNIQAFIQRAMIEEKGFVDMDLEKKKELLEKYALEIITENEPKVLPDPGAESGLDDQGNPIDPKMNGKITANLNI